MYKHLFRAVLWVVWIFWILSLWVVDAKSETIYITGTDWTIIQTNEQEREDLELYFRSNINNDNIDLHYTIMDRNLWATTNDISSTWSYGYYYQWWNNYGFRYPFSGTTFSSEKIDTTEFWPWNYYASNVFYADDWHYSEDDNENLWWGEWDTINMDWEYTTIEGRQWPCPSWYHIPSMREMNIWSYFTSAHSLFVTWYNDMSPYAGTVVAKEKKLLWALPLCTNEEEPENCGDLAIYYWSSPYSYLIRWCDNYGSYYCAPYENNTNVFSLSNRSDAFPVRCYKNIPNDGISINLNWGNGKVSISVYWNEIISFQWILISKSNAKFGWWYWNEEFIWNQIQTWSNISGLSGIYAKFTCNTGYEENSSHYCEAINYSIDYEFNGGTLSWSNKSSYNINTNTFTLNNPIKTWYEFLWWTWSNGDVPQTTVSIPEWSMGNKKYYANWTLKEYTITYNLNDWTEGRTNPTTYTVESWTFWLYQPTKTGYMFLWWTWSNGNSVNANIYITKWSTWDRTYTAVWWNFEDIDVYFISDTWVVSYITLMDRNMWATEVYNWSSYSPNTWSYGFHYQWWNNNWFQIWCWTDPCSDQVTTNATSIKVLWNSNYDNKWYNWIIFISSGYDYWVWNNHYDGLWWWSGDAESNNWRLDTMTLGSVRDRQWPCPDGYHVPSAWEWQKLSEYRCKSNLNYCTWSWTYQYFDLSLWWEFLSYFKIPFAGYRTTNGWIKDVNDETQYEYGAYYRSSSPRDVSKLDRAWGLYYNPYDIYFDYINHRSSAQSIRCFSNDYLFTDSSMIIHPNGWTGAMILVEWSKIKSLWNPKRVNSKFEWWYDSDTEWIKMKNWSDAPTNLYARWSCKSWYVENNSGTWCIELYTIAYELNDWILSWENVTWYTIESDDITLINPTKTWYTFTWWSGTDIDGFSWTVVIPSWSTWYRVYEANRTPIEYEITYELNWWTNSPNNVTLYTIESNITFENPTKNWYNFDGWFTDVQFTTWITAIPVWTTWPIIIYAKWTKIETKSSWSSGWWGWGGGWGGSSKTDTGSTASQTWNQINSNTWDTASTWNIKEPVTNTGSNIQTWSQQPLSPTDSSPDREQTVTPLIGGDSEARGGWTQTYTQEFQEAYEFAKWNGITTMPTIQKANMEWKLTRIAMAKMLSQYAMNVLWQKPANIITPKFNDVTDKQNSDYDDWVTLAYQLWIMWQNMPWNNFRPNDEVTRAEFATALSRMAYWTSDWEYKWTAKYYIHHMEKLVREWIITNDDPNMKELRWYVMIMLMRSSK